MPPTGSEQPSGRVGKTADTRDLADETTFDGHRHRSESDGNTLVDVVPKRPVSTRNQDNSVSDQTRSQTRAQTRAITRTHIIVIVCGCILVFGNYYSYDLPAALNVPMRALLGSDYSLFQWQLNLLYTIYSMPNIVMPLIGGAIYDRLGPRAMLFTFSALVIGGAALFWLGLALQSFPLLFTSRLLFGFGGESLEVAGTSIVTTWYQGTGYLSLALGINMSTSRIAAAIQNSVTPWLVTMVPLDNSSWLLRWTTGPALAACVTVALCVVSLFAAFVLVRVKQGHGGSSHTARPASIVQVPEIQVEHDHVNSTSGGSMTAVSCPSSPSLSPIKHTRTPSNSKSTSPPYIISEFGNDTAAANGHLRPLSPGAPRKSIDDSRLSMCASVTGTPIWLRPSFEHAEQRSPLSPASPKSVAQASWWSNVKRLNPSFWILCLLTMLLYGSVMPFLHISSDFIQSKWYPGDLQTAGALMSLSDLLCAILTPLLGLLADKLGQPARLLPLAGLLVTLAHALLFFTLLPPAGALVLLGIASAMFAATLWPSVSVLVPERLLGTAYGAVTVALNVALAAIPLCVAALNGGVEGGEREGEEGHTAAVSAEHWTQVGTMFVCTSVASVVVSVVLLARDWLGDRVLCGAKVGPSELGHKRNDDDDSIGGGGVGGKKAVGAEKAEATAIDVGTTSSTESSPTEVHHRHKHVVKDEGDGDVELVQ